MSEVEDKRGMGLFCSSVCPYSTVQEKEKLFSTLQETVSGLQRMDRVIIMGDFNVRVGDRRGEWREVIGGVERRLTMTMEEGF